MTKNHICGKDIRSLKSGKSTMVKSQFDAGRKASLIAYACRTELDENHQVRFGGLGRVGAKFKVYIILTSKKL